jgi:hypothetical protein
MPHEARALRKFPAVVERAAPQHVVFIGRAGRPFEHVAGHVHTSVQAVSHRRELPHRAGRSAAKRFRTIRGNCQGFAQAYRICLNFQLLVVGFLGSDIIRRTTGISWTR